MRKLLVLFFILIFLTGCSEFHWITPEPTDASLLPTVTVTPEPPPLPSVQPEVVPAEEVGVIAPDPTPQPPCEVIKGNISRSGEKIYHVPGGANYNQVKIDESAGEAFFCSEAEAQAAGFRKAAH